MRIFKNIFKPKQVEDLPVKEVQIEQWRLPERFFPMILANFQFTDDYTTVTIWGDDAEILYQHEFKAFEFDGIEEWLKDILITCRVIEK